MRWISVTETNQTYVTESGLIDEKKECFKKIV